MEDRCSKAFAKAALASTEPPLTMPVKRPAGPLSCQRLLEHAVHGQLAAALQHRLCKVQRHRDAGCRCTACSAHTFCPLCTLPDRTAQAGPSCTSWSAEGCHAQHLRCPRVPNFIALRDAVLPDGQVGGAVWALQGPRSTLTRTTAQRTQTSRRVHASCLCRSRQRGLPPAKPPRMRCSQVRSLATARRRSSVLRRALVQRELDGDVRDVPQQRRQQPVIQPARCPPSPQCSAHPAMQCCSVRTLHVARRLH